VPPVALSRVSITRVLPADFVEDGWADDDRATRRGWCALLIVSYARCHGLTHIVVRSHRFVIFVVVRDEWILLLDLPTVVGLLANGIVVGDTWVATQVCGGVFQLLSNNDKPSRVKRTLVIGGGDETSTKTCSHDCSLDFRYAYLVPNR
jgi:hypothetical protein